MLLFGLLDGGQDLAQLLQQVASASPHRSQLATVANDRVFQIERMTPLVVGGRLAGGNALADLRNLTLARSRRSVGSFELGFESVRLVFLRESQIDLRLNSRT